MRKTRYPNRFLILLLIATLWLPACNLPTMIGSQPAAEQAPAPAGEGQVELESGVPASIEDSPSALEGSPDFLPTLPAQVVVILPLIIVQDETGPECLSPEAQLLAEHISDGFEIPVEAVMGWYCQGFEFEDILLALQTSTGLEITPDELLVRLDQGQTWDEIWKDTGLLK